MNNKKFELKLKNAFNQITPDVLDSVMDKCHTQEKTEVITITSSGKKNYALWYTTVAAVFIAIVSIFLIYSYKPTNIQKTAATVYFETDNVLELQLDENNIILNGEHKGESFVNVIKDLFSSKNYKDNSVLVSVVNTDTVRANKLQGYISDVVNKSEYTILSQSYYLDGEILSISDRYEISYSKANLLRDIINTNGLYSYTELSTYSLNQINMLFKYGGVTSGDVVSMGKNTDEDFLSYNEAKEIAFPGKDNCNGKMVFFNNRLSYMIVCEENVLYVDIFTGEILYAVSMPEIIVTESPEVIVTPFPSVYPRPTFTFDPTFRPQLTPELTPQFTPKITNTPFPVRTIPPLTTTFLPIIEKTPIPTVTATPRPSESLTPSNTPTPKPTVSYAPTVTPWPVPTQQPTMEPWPEATSLPDIPTLPPIIQATCVPED